MKRCFPFVGRSLRHTLDFAGLSGRAEFVCTLVMSQVPLLLALPTRLIAPPDLVAPIVLALSWLCLAPVPALVSRRLRDAGLPPVCGLVLLVLAARTLGLDLLALAGPALRDSVETGLSYLDWLLMLPAFVLALLLVVLPSRTAHDADPKTADAAQAAPVE